MRGARDGDELVLTVRDYGIGIGNDGLAPSDGIGLRNTDERLEQLYGPARRLDLRDASEGGLLVTARVPFRAAHADRGGHQES